MFDVSSLKLLRELRIHSNFRLGKFPHKQLQVAVRSTCLNTDFNTVCSGFDVSYQKQTEGTRGEKDLMLVDVWNEK